MRLIGKTAMWFARFFIYGVVWGLLYDHAGYMKSIKDVE
jgi:hypothetical protein